MGRGWRAGQGRGRDHTLKRGADTAPLTDLVRNKDIYMRMNFLYQLALVTAAGTAQSQALSRFYAHTMKKIGSRLVIRVHPTVKGTLCKHCHALLLPAVTGNDTESEGGSGATVELMTTNHPHLVRACRRCGTKRRVGTRQELRELEIESEQQPSSSSANTSTDAVSQPTTTSATAQFTSDPPAHTGQPQPQTMPTMTAAEHPAAGADFDDSSMTDDDAVIAAESR